MTTVVDKPSTGRARVSSGSGRRIRSSVQVPFIHERRSSEHHVEALLIFVLFGAAFGALGYWVVIDMRVVTFGSLNRLTGAYLAWHGAPAKLAAVGFVYPPLQTLLLLPFTAISNMATSLVALPVLSAIFGGASMVAVNRLLERCDMPALMRYAVMILLAVTPTVAFYSASGGSEMIGLFMLIAGLSSLIAWYRTVDTRYLISASAAFALATMANYDYGLWMALAALMVAGILARHGADDSEIEGSLITFATPAIYGLGLWCLCNWLIIRSPFGWITANSATTVAVTHSVAASATAATAFVDSFKLAFAAAPLVFVVFPALVVAAMVKRNEIAGWLAAFCLMSFFTPAVDALLRGNIADMQMSSALPTLAVSVIGAAWLFQSLPDARASIGAGMIVSLLATIVLVWHGMNTYRYQDMEQAFRAIVTTRSSAPPKTALGGRSVGITQEQKMAVYIRDHVSDPGSILTDNSQTFGVILLSAKPRLFRTRLVNGNGEFQSEVDNVPHKVKYFLVAIRDRSDAINRAYPGAAQNLRSQLHVVYKDSRYALISVEPGTTRMNSTRNNSQADQQPLEVITP